MHESYLSSGLFLGRVWRNEVNGPSLVTIREGRVLDITCRDAPMIRDIIEMDNPVAYVKSVVGVDICAAKDLMENGHVNGITLLAPLDIQSIKACGVTFARSMLERVIEERAAGDLEQAAAIRKRVLTLIGDSLKNIKAGSKEAELVKAALIEEGMWSQYLEVGIGPDAEVFSKSQVLSSVGHGADIGLHPNSNWNNPEPEIVLAVDSQGTIKGATLGNDVNLRDFEGRSALLLTKAKDNNASCSIGPFIRLFDETYGLDDVRNAEIDLLIEGKDGFVLEGKSSMQEISRDPLDLVAQTLGRHHQYPDGLMLFLGTAFAPVKDRGLAGQGFTHHIDDVVTISNRQLGVLRNQVKLSTQCSEWTFGISHFMRNLASRGLL